MVPDLGRRCLITGVGVVAPNGIGTEAWWEATKAGTSGIKRISLFEPDKYTTQLAGEVTDFSADDWIERRLQVQTDRWTHMALAATKMAFEDASYDPASFDEWSTGAITASSSGGNEFGQKEIQALWGRGPKFVGAYQSIAWFYAATTGQISIRHGLKGPCGVVLAEGAGGLEALQHTRRTLRRGVDAAVSGGLEAPIGPYALTCQLGNGYLSSASDPADAYRPFDRRANGYVPGEGGAILLVESSARAQERGAPKVYAEIAGYGATNDAHHWRKPPEDPRQFARAITIALSDAGIAADDVDAVFADAFGEPEWDAIEVAALKSALGDKATSAPVTAPKSMVGRLYAGGASLDVAAAVLAMRDGVIPPTVNLDDPADGFDLDFVTSAREAELRTVLVVARGYGGFNAALVLRRAE
jgi:minimal PKS chain-length factor (CLF/KS beta)